MLQKVLLLIHLGQLHEKILQGRLSYKEKEDNEECISQHWSDLTSIFSPYNRWCHYNAAEVWVPYYLWMTMIALFQQNLAVVIYFSLLDRDR